MTIYSVYLVSGLMRIPFNWHVMQYHTAHEENPQPHHCENLVTCMYFNVI